MPTAPLLKAPPGTCDTHMHVYEKRFPLASTWNVEPPHAPAADYKVVQRELGIERCVVVQPNAYGFDNACTLEAIAALGPHARGIATVRPDVTDAELRRLHASGIRGARLFMLPGTLFTWDDVRAISARIAPLGWHVQVQLDGRDMPRYEILLRELPTEVVVDHNGKFMEPVATDHPAFLALLRLLDEGRSWVKLSAPYETSKTGAPRYADVSALARALAQHHPEHCLWASNWPHPGQAIVPSTAALLDLMLDWAPDPAVRQRVLVDNPARLYGF